LRPGDGLHPIVHCQLAVVALAVEM